MNKPHKHKDLIIAWANNSSLQFELKTDRGNWVAVGKAPDWCPTVEYRIKPKVWEPAVGNYTVDSMGGVQWEANPLAAEFGSSRNSRETADRAVEEMRIHNRLLAYRDEFCPDYKPEWPSEDPDEANYVFKENGKYDSSISCDREIIGVVYFPKDVAEDLVRKLNTGEVVL